MIAQVKRRPAIETPEERDLRLKSLALVAKLNPLLGKFYASPDLIAENIERNLSARNVDRLNVAYNKLRSGGDLEEKEQQVIVGIIKAAILMSFKPVKEFLGEVKYGAFVLMLAQKFVEQYTGAKFQVPEEISEELGDDGSDKTDSDSDAEDADKDDADAGDSSDDASKDADDKGSEDEDDDGEDDDGGEDEEDEELESESANKPKGELHNVDAPMMIVVDLIKYFQKMNWEEIAKRLVQIKEAEGFESKSADDLVNKRLTFRVASKQRHRAKPLVNLYEIVLNGKPIGLIHSLQDDDNGFNKRIWRVAIRNHFNDAKYRSGYSPDEPFSLVRGKNIVLHNPIPSTMKEARAWARVAVEK